MSGADDTVRGMSMLIDRVRDFEASLRIGRALAPVIGHKFDAPMSKYLRTGPEHELMTETIYRAFIAPVKADGGACTVAVDPGAPGGDSWTRSWWDGERLVTEAINQADVYTTATYGESTLPADLQKKIDEDLAWSMCDLSATHRMTGEHLAWKQAAESRNRRVVRKTRNVGISSSVESMRLLGWTDTPVAPGKRTRLWSSLRTLIEAGAIRLPA